MLQNQLKSHKVNGENSLFREKYLVGFELFGDLEAAKGDKKAELLNNLNNSLAILKQGNEETTESDTTIEQAIYEFLEDEHDMDSEAASIVAKHISNKLKASNQAYPDKTLLDKEITVKNDKSQISVEVRKENSFWSGYDLEADDQVLFSGTVTLENADITEMISQNIANKEVAASTIDSHLNLDQLKEDVTNGHTRNTRKFELEQTLGQIKEKPLSEDELYQIPQTFFDKFPNDKAAREAIVTGQVEDHQNFIKLFNQLGINQREFLNKGFGDAGIFGNALEGGVTAGEIFKISKFGGSYNSLEKMQDRLQILAKNPANNRDELNIISRGLRDIRALGHMLSKLEYHAPTKKSPDYISEINFSKDLDTKSKEAFKDNPEILMALMGYLYGLDNMENKQLVSYSLNEDKQYQASIKKIPAEDFAVLNEAYQKIDTLRWSFTDNSLTEGISELTKPEHAKVRALLDKAKLEKVGKDSNAVKDIAALIANPLNTGPINEAYETLTYEEMQGRGATAEVSEFVNRQYSEKGIYETILRDSRDLDTNSFSQTKLETNLKRYAELGRLYLSQNPEALKKEKNLLGKQWPENTGITNALGDRDLVKLVRYGFLLDQKIARAAERQLNGLDADLASKKIDPQELAHFLAGLHIDQKGINRLGAGAALVINFDEAGNPVQNSIHIGAVTDVLNLPDTALIFTFTRENNEDGTDASVGTAVNFVSASIGFSAGFGLGEDKKYHLRFNGGIGQFGPFLAAGIGAGFGRKLETYVAEHEQTTIKKHYDKNGTIFEELTKAKLESKSEAEQMTIVRKIKHLDDLYRYFQSQNGLNENQINDLFLGENGLVKELQNNIRNYAVENTDDFGWEVGGGVATISGMPLPIPYAYVSFELPAGTIMRYSVPSDVPANAKVALEDKIQEQLKNQAQNSNHVIVTEAASGEVHVNKDNGNWRVTNSRELPDLGFITENPQEKAKALTNYYKQYGLTFSEITDPAYTGTDGLKDKGYLAMELNADFVGDANVEIHVDPSAQGIHLTTLGEGVKDNKIQFAANINGAKNLVITRREVLKPTGVSDIVITISDKTSTLEEIETKEQGYYHYQNGRLEHVKGAYYKGKIVQSPEQLNLAGASRRFESQLFNSGLITPEVIATSKALNDHFAAPNTLNTITTEQKTKLDGLVKRLTTKGKTKEFARFSTLKLTDFESPDNKKVAQFINTEFKKANSKQSPTPAEFQYLYEQLTEATFVNLDNIGAKERHIRSGITRMQKYIEATLTQSKTLQNKFTLEEVNQIKTLSKSYFEEVIKNLNFNNLEENNLKSVDLEESYIVSVAANLQVGVENRGFRFVDVNENSTINFLKNSVTKYSLISSDPAEKLFARFILELSDPIPESANFQEAETLLGSQLLAKIATLPIGKANGETVNFLPLALGTHPSTLILQLIKEPKLINDSLRHQKAYYELHKLLKDIRTKQISGEPLTLDIKDDSGIMSIELKFPTDLASLLLERCGNTTFASHQGIEVKVRGEQGQLLGASAETSLGTGYQGAAESDTVNVSLGVTVPLPNLETPTPNTPPAKGPVPDRPDNPGGGGTPPPGGGAKGPVAKPAR